jgi:hypothetical protein
MRRSRSCVGETSSAQTDIHRLIAERPIRRIGYPRPVLAQWVAAKALRWRRSNCVPGVSHSPPKAGVAQPARRLDRGSDHWRSRWWARACSARDGLAAEISAQPSPAVATCKPQTLSRRPSRLARSQKMQAFFAKIGDVFAALRPWGQQLGPRCFYKLLSRRQAGG